MIKSKIVLLSALVSCALISGCKEENKTHVSIEFMHSSVEQERQAVISKLIARFEKENPGITVKQVPVEEDAYNTKVITLSRSGSLPEVIETSHDYAKVMDKEQLIDRKAVATVISNVGEGAFYDGVYSAAIFLIPICISFDTAEKRRYATYLILNRRFSFEF